MTPLTAYWRMEALLDCLNGWDDLIRDLRASEGRLINTDTLEQRVGALRTLATLQMRCIERRMGFGKVVER